MPQTIAQQYLFDRIKELVPPSQSVVVVVAEILHISEDSSYRRIRGETPLVLEEARELCIHFKLSLDKLFNLNNQSTHFETIRINNESYSFETFLTDIIKRLHYVNKSEQPHIYYLTKDIPLFYHFLFKPLFAFRYFFWMKSILQHPDFIDRKFTVDCLPVRVQELGNCILQLYNQVPSTEIWNTESINSILFQIDYYKAAGFFQSYSDIKGVYTSLDDSILHIQQQAESGKKWLPNETSSYKPENFSFFYNRITLGDNTILVTSTGGKMTFLNFEVLNYMFTTDEEFCKDTYESLQNLLRRSTMISQVSEKQRNIFFNIVRHKIEDRIQHL